jgi:hypothetical protein
MKKISTALLAVILAIVSFAFTDMKSPKTSYYWFQLNPTTGNPINATSQPQLLSSDPLGCSAGTKYCGGGYNGFVDNGDGTYSPTGTRQVTDKKP